MNRGAQPAGAGRARRRVPPASAVTMTFWTPLSSITPPARPRRRRRQRQESVRTTHSAVGSTGGAPSYFRGRERFPRERHANSGRGDGARRGLGCPSRSSPVCSDSSVMNVSISQVVAEPRHHRRPALQLAITMYTLVMAAFMLIGGKIGDRWGAKRAFWIGGLVYGAGSLTTALSPNLGVLLVGWSLVEGLGAVLVIPAIAALTAATYQGKQRAIAYGILGGVSGASMAAGPMIGGWVTANLSWRYVFAGETVVMLVLMLFLKVLPATVGRKSKLDIGGAVLLGRWTWRGRVRSPEVEPVGMGDSEGRGASVPARAVADLVADRDRRRPAVAVRAPGGTRHGARRGAIARSARCRRSRGCGPGWWCSGARRSSSRAPSS